MFDQAPIPDGDPALAASSVRTRLESEEPGGRLGALIASLEVASLDDFDLVSFLGACERQAAWIASVGLAATSELARRRSAKGDLGDMTAMEIGAELRLSPAASEARLALALDLDDLPRTRLLLAIGKIDLAKARALVDAVAGLDPEQAAAVEARVLDRAPEQTLPAFRQSLRRAVIVVDPSSAERRHAAAVADRSVQLYPAADGMADVVHHLPAEDAAAYYMYISARAEMAKGPDDDRTIGQRRADVAADIGWQGLAQRDLPRRHGRPVQVGVVVAATTLLGLDQEPAELTGYGPITAERARRVASDATWQAIFVDQEDGTLRRLGTKLHDPPQDLRDHIIARDQTCRFVGCRRPANLCDLDHTTSFPEGPTEEGNLGPLHRFHHNGKTGGSWILEQPRPGVFVWTSPAGKRYVVPAEPILDTAWWRPPPAAPPPPSDPDPPPGPASDDIPPF